MSARATIDDVVLSLLNFEHRFIPYEGMRRSELFARVMADMEHDVEPDAILTQAHARVGDMVTDALAAEEAEADTPEADVVSDEDMRRITIAATAATAWVEGFALGVYHARRLAEGGDVRARRGFGS